ncbi:alpha/beta-hydrolase [Trichodelitschia bisporula]|uniref:Carboxylic ester hydrolase n=1 Tax=Trichodelitschia bisporula TaxID=703511 RepID=A0A6G1I3B3_9PEZI|nr:alpha/beta-hydrolase [Trichodelitschia bisporula]
MRSFCIALAALAAQLAEAQSSWAVGQGVRTRSGFTVTGRKGRLAPEVSEYLGVPYAAPPVGNLRWKPPQPYKGNGTIKATDFGPSCPSRDAISSKTQDEDCLTLNIWTKMQTGEKAKAVLVSIYGGGFNVGESRTPYLNGAPLADQQDVVVVSMNYRLNIFGFPGVPGFEHQNMGMEDIRASIEWVRDNIAAFGGDPKRITLFGESAGGGATDAYAFAWPEDPIVAGFIPQSGSVFTRGISDKNNLGPWFNASSKLGCGGPEAGEKSIPCMRTKSWRQIMKYVNTGPRVPGTTFGPTYDDKIIWEDYAARVKLGAFAKRPTFTGSTHNEGGFFRVVKRQMTDSDVTRMNLCFTCVAMKSAKARIDYKIPIWRYRYFADYPNNRIMPGAGAYHGSELPLVFGTPKLHNNNGSSKDTADEAALTKVMMTAWANFAKDPEHGLTKLGYKAYDPNDTTLIRFGFNNKPEVSYGNPNEYDKDCTKYEVSTDSIDTILGQYP